MPLTGNSFAYNGGGSNLPSTAGTGSDSLTRYPFSSGIFLCSILQPYQTTNPSSTQTNGLILQYRQTKEFTQVLDATAGIYLGRNKPVLEYGQYQFYMASFTFYVPPVAVAVGGYHPGQDFDGNAIVKTLGNMAANQMGGGSGGSALLVNLQDAALLDSNGYASSYVGMIYDYKRSPQIDPAGWTSVSFSFVEIQVS